MIEQPIKHVLMSADTVGGVWTYALELSRTLSESGIRVSLATMGAALRPDQRAEAEECSNLTVFESEYQLEWMSDPWHDVEASGEWLLRLEQTLKPDVVHLNSYAHGALAWTCPSIVVAHSCVLSWWLAVERQQAPATWNEYRKRITAGIQAASCTVGVSQAMLMDVRRFYGEPRSAATIPNGRRAVPPRVDLKQPLILSSGRVWDRAKNTAALQHVAAELDWTVAVAGEGAPDSGAVQWLGRLSSSEMATWFSRASIYAAPAFYEPFGLAILEAALAGCALVLGDIPSLRENWDGAAIFVAPDDNPALKRTLARLISDTSLRQRMSALAIERAALFTPERMEAGYRKVYANAASIMSSPCV